jgi:hypothetical protein
MNELSNKKHVFKTTLMIMFVAMVASFVVKPAVNASTSDFTVTTTLTEDCFIVSTASSLHMT